MQPVTRNRKYPKGLNNVPCVIRSCNKLHATRESRITYRGWFIRATSCTLHSKWITLLMVDNALFEKTHAKITALYFMPWLIWSSIKMHVTRQSINYTSGLIIRATSCTLRVKWITRNTLIEKIFPKITALFYLSYVLWGEWWVEIAWIAQAAILQTKKARLLTLL